MNGRRRGRDEYERDNGSSPLGPTRHSPLSNQHLHEAKRVTLAVRGGTAEPRLEERERDSEDWRAKLGGEGKKEEFLRLMERAWDLFHE